MDRLLDALNTALPDLFRVLDLLGVFCNGVLGGRLARLKRFDAVGFFFLAIIAATGGGLLRDILLQEGPPVAITDPLYLPVALLGACIALLWKFDSRPARIILIFADGAVLGSWAATGALKTIQAGHGILPALLLGIMTAIGGGMIRDIMAGNVPTVFGGNHLYATPALVSAGIMIIFRSPDYQTLGMLLSVLVCFPITMLARRKGWTLPQNPDWTLSLTSTQIRKLMRMRGPGWTVRRKDVEEHLRRMHVNPPAEGESPHTSDQ